MGEMAEMAYMNGFEAMLDGDESIYSSHYSYRRPFRKYSPEQIDAYYAEKDAEESTLDSFLDMPYYARKGAILREWDNL